MGNSFLSAGCANDFKALYESSTKGSNRTAAFDGRRLWMVQPLAMGYSAMVRCGYFGGYRLYAVFCGYKATDGRNFVLCEGIRSACYCMEGNDSLYK